MQLNCICYFCSMKTNKYANTLDGIGITASTLCAIHCASLPFIFTMLPLTGLNFLGERWIELMMIGIALIIGVLSLVSSFRKKHGKKMPLYVLAMGFGLIFLGHIIQADLLEAILTPV